MEFKFEDKIKNDHKLHLFIFILGLILISLLVSIFPLPIFGEVELIWIKQIQEFLNTIFLDFLMLFAYFVYYYFLIIISLVLIFKKDKKLGFISIIFIFLYVVISYLLIKSMKLVVEVPPRYLGARDVLEIYLPKTMLKLWVGTWGFPSEHLVLSAFFTEMLFYFLLQKNFLKFIFIIFSLLTYFSTLYLGDHYISDLFLNFLVGSTIFFGTSFIHSRIKHFVKK